MTLCHSTVLLKSKIHNNSLCSCQGVNVWCWESVITLVSRDIKSILPVLNHSSRKMTIVAQWHVCKCTHKSVACFPPCTPTRSASVVARLTWGCFYLLLVSVLCFAGLGRSRFQTWVRVLFCRVWGTNHDLHRPCFESGSRTLWFDSTSLAPIVSWHLSAFNSLIKS